MANETETSKEPKQKPSQVGRASVSKYQQAERNDKSNISNPRIKEIRKGVKTDRGREAKTGTCSCIEIEFQRLASLS